MSASSYLLTICAYHFLTLRANNLMPKCFHSFLAVAKTIEELNPKRKDVVNVL